MLLAAIRKQTGVPLPIAADLRRDHGVIAKLLVPTPTKAICDELRAILSRHNAIEEGPGGLYATCDEALAHDVETILKSMSEYPEVPTAKHYDGPLLRR